MSTNHRTYTLPASSNSELKVGDILKNGDAQGYVHGRIMKIGKPRNNWVRVTIDPSDKGPL